MQTVLSPWWRRGALAVLVVGFSILAAITVMTYRNAPPIPVRVTGSAGQVVFTGEDILDGQEVFLKYALMEHGTLWGHGAYLGPDYSAAYLHREAEIVSETIARQRFGRDYAALAPEDRLAAGAIVRDVLKTNRYDPATGTLTYTAGEETSFANQTVEWTAYFEKGAPGLPAGYIQRPEDVRSLTSYFAWASWSARANRPGRAYSYTGNWPYEPLAGNGPTVEALVWSGISLMFLLGGLGLILFLFGRFDFLGWKGEPSEARTATDAPSVPLLPLPTPSQRVTAWYFAVVAVLFLLQVLMGGALAHYRVEPGGFYGFDLAKYLPYNLLRSWHLQLAVFWIATAWVGGGLFLAPILGGREPKGQHLGAIALLGALAIVVFGSLFGEYLGINDRLGRLWFWLGHQGSEYLDLGRFWQVLLASGLVGWLFLMFRAIRPALADPARREFASLFMAGASGIVVFYLPAFFYGARTNFAIIDNWRFWIIHLWVEGFFELFATVLVAMMFTHMGLVKTKTATRVVYLDAILYLSGGIVGTAHHWYFTGQESIAIALGACFSALEVVPLTLLTLDAWDFIRLGRPDRHEERPRLTPGQQWAVYFLMAVGFWNFVGAGVFGFLINLPIVSYFEVGTTLTPNHGHAAMFGVFGMLALGVLVYCLRTMVTEERWSSVERYFRTGFWGVNIGLALMIVLNLFPAGVVQLADVVRNGYAHARSEQFTMTGFFHASEWVRIAGDLTFIVVGVVPIVIGTLKALVLIGRPTVEAESARARALATTP